MACRGTRALGDSVPLVLSQSQEAALPPWWPSGAQPIGWSTASSRRHMAGGDVQNTRAADVQSLGEAPQQRGAGQGWPRLGIRTRTPLSLPPSTTKPVPAMAQKGQVWRGETRGGCGRCPRGHSPMIGGLPPAVFAHLLLPASPHPRHVLGTVDLQAPFSHPEGKSQGSSMSRTGWDTTGRLCAPAPQATDSAGKSKQWNYVASLGFQKTQLAAGWRTPWAQRPELRKMRDTKEGTKRPTLTLTVARAWPWVRPQHLLLSPRLPPVFRGVQPFFLALAGCPGAAQGP